MKKDSFILHDDQYECFSLLPIEQRGLLITAIFEYRLNGKTTQPLSEAAYMAYHLISCQIQRDTEKYERLCERRREYGAMNNKHKQAKASISKQKLANESYTDTDTDTDTDTVTDTVTDTELPKGNKEESIKEEKRKRFLPPSLEEIRQYCIERRNSVNAEQFIDFYTANGWKVGKNSMKDWKAAVRTWERNGIQNKGVREFTEAEKADTEAFIQRQFERFEEIGNGL